jgi:hypothetical protein
MKPTVLFLFSFFAVPSCLSAQQDSTDMLIGDWYANGYGKKEISINDTVGFTKAKLECNTPDCDFKEWVFKSNGDFQNRNSYAYVLNPSGHVSYIGTSSKNLKWGVLKKTVEIIISGDKYRKTFKILSINTSKLVVKRLR